MAATLPETRIGTLESFREHSQWTVELEVARNRVTLCRRGHAGYKPLCDRTHRETGFHE